MMNEIVHVAIAAEYLNENASHQPRILKVQGLRGCWIAPAQTRDELRLVRKFLRQRQHLRPGWWGRLGVSVASHGLDRHGSDW